jgi:hypothetical protein
MINKEKIYTTRDGREVRIYAIDGRKWTEVHGAIRENNGWAICHWSADGKHDHISDNCLVEVKPKIRRTVWLNVWSNNVRAFSSEYAAGSEGRGRIACVKVDIDVEEGHGI